jgi:hypothetical protein
MNAVWVVVLLAVVGVVIALISSWQRRDPDLGAVSHQWISEHRVDAGHNQRQ